MSTYLAQRVNEIIPNLMIEDIEMDSILTLNCSIHGEYQKSVRTILYKNPNCPECTRLNRNKKLSEIGKTKIGELNSFYGHKHSEETKQKLSNAWLGDTTERREKISKSVKSEKCQQKRRKTLLERYGNEKYTNKEKAKKTIISRYGGMGNASPIIREHMQKTCQNKYGVNSILSLKETHDKAKQTKLEKYGDENYNNREKAKETCLERYGIDIPNKYGSEIYFNNMIEKYGESWLSFVGVKANEGNRRRISKFEKEHDCTNEITLIKKYGQGWLYIKNNINLIKNGQNVYIPNNEIWKIEQYNAEVFRNFVSHKEKELVSAIKSIYNGEILENDRKIIAPKELDIYMPDLQLAVEFNGLRWHSIELGTDMNYHLNKSILCREKGIRLVHIYEFEDFETQKQFLCDLILGEDRFPKNDFNKNNFLSIPQPEIIYQDDKYTVYGAGKLY